MASTPASTTGAAFISRLKSSVIETGQTPVPTAVNVTTAVPVAPASEAITGVKVLAPEII